MSQLVTLATVVFVLLACPLPAAAYLDPVSGSVAFQVVMASALTAAAALRIYWRRLTGFLRKNESEARSDDGYGQTK